MKTYRLHVTTTEECAADTPRDAARKTFVADRHVVHVRVYDVSESGGEWSLAELSREDFPELMGK